MTEVTTTGVRRRRASDVNLKSESCWGELLSLERFSCSPKLFRARDKGPIERLLNPFGDLWSDRKRNPHIPVMTASCLANWRIRRPAVDGLLKGNLNPTHPETETYRTFLHLASSPYHYDETVTKIAVDMPAFREMKADFERLVLRKKFIGYAVLNFHEGQLFREDPPEWAYLHAPRSSMNRADRIRFKDSSTLIASGDVFDVSKPEVRSFLAGVLRDCMVENDVDAVLIDYAVRPYAFGMPSLIDILPEEWVDAFQENQIALMEEVHAELRAHGKELLLNGLMLEGIVPTEISHVRPFIKCCDGMFWEQPFRFEWRDYHDGDSNYYERLQEFFDLVYGLRKKLFVKQGTYRFHATEDIEPSWHARFAYTDSGIERHLVEYLTCFYLLYSDAHRSTLLYTHPVEAGDIFASEAMFKIWNTDTGWPLGGRMALHNHIHMRAFEKGIVFVNCQLKPARISDKLRPSGFDRALPRIELQPLSGIFWPYPKQGILSSMFGGVKSRSSATSEAGAEKTET